MQVHRIRSYSEFIEHERRDADTLSKHMRAIEKFVPADHSPFHIPGFSYTAGRQVDFLVDFQYAFGDSINWRERVCCPITGLNNRMRATIHLFDCEVNTYADSKIYLTEQVTPTYSYFASKYREVVGSEYLGDQVALGECNERGIRNESLSALTFPSHSFDAVVSLDVFEHIPDYYRAFQECARVLRPKGKLMWSVPFISSSPENIVRARIKGGEIEHILEAEYHGDPVSSGGILCYTQFGWEMLAQMESAGFKDAYAIYYRSLKFGYLGGGGVIFVAEKGNQY